MYMLCYASKFKPDKQVTLKEILQIGEQSRPFTFKNNITDALCFADGYLLEYLEGPSSVLFPLMERIAQDQRHHHLTYFAEEKIEIRKFSDWNIYYLSKNHPAYLLCQHMGFERFEPLQFNQDHVDMMIDILIQEIHT